MTETTHEPNLLRAIAKLKPEGPDAWCAPLMPAEIVALADAGAVPTLESHVIRARESVAKGEGLTTWFYFTPGKELRARILKATT